jgi:hypothetical protein
MGWSKAPANAPLWQVIMTSYDVLTAERHEMDTIEIAISSDSGETASTEESQVSRVFTTYFQLEGSGNEPQMPCGLASSGSHLSGTII